MVALGDLFVAEGFEFAGGREFAFRGVEVLRRGQSPSLHTGFEPVAGSLVLGDGDVMFFAVFAFVLGFKEGLVGLFVCEIAPGVMELSVEGVDGLRGFFYFFAGSGGVAFCCFVLLLEFREGGVALFLKVGYGFGGVLERGDTGTAGWAVFELGEDGGVVGGGRLVLIAFFRCGR